MKHLMIALISAVTTILVVIILMSVHSKDLRQTELERALKSAAGQSLENACLTQKPRINDNDALVADFISSFLGKMKTGSSMTSEDGKVYTQEKSDPGQKLEIKILAADIYRGIISAKVSENFTYPNGKKGKVTASTTQIVERESRRPSEYVNYYIPWQVARAAGFDYVEGEDFLYYQKRYAKGMTVDTDIEEPEPRGYKFKGWNSEKENGVIKYTAIYE